MPDAGWVDAVILGIELVEAHPITTKGVIPAESNLNMQTIPAINDGWSDVDTGNAGRRNKEMSNKAIKCTDKARVFEQPMQISGTAASDELINSGVCKRQYGDALARR
jgi:hypothetical protein